jgi:hypothetical protein
VIKGYVYSRYCRQAAVASRKDPTLTSNRRMIASARATVWLLRLTFQKALARIFSLSVPLIPVLFDLITQNNPVRQPKVLINDPSGACLVMNVSP